jgi:hypothetical protein
VNEWQFELSLHFTTTTKTKQNHHKNCEIDRENGHVQKMANRPATVNQHHTKLSQTPHTTPQLPPAAPKLEALTMKSM